MSFQRLNDDLAVALTWLTRLPVQFPASAPTLARSAWTFPVVGAIVGGIAAFVFIVAEWAGAPVLLASVLAIACMTLITGALHEDGLADFFDGLGARGGKTEKLAAMRDSRIGAYGVLALIIIFSVRVTAVSNAEVALSLIVVAALSRAAMVHAMHTLPPARTDGAAHAAGAPGSTEARSAMLIAGALLVLWILLAGFALIGGALIAAAGVLALWWVIGKARTSLGGVTGDVLGALCLLSETAMLVVVSVWLT